MGSNLRRIGVLTPFFKTPSYFERLKGISDSLLDKPYELVIYSVEQEHQLQDYLNTMSMDSCLAGLIIMSLNLGPAMVETLLSHDLPVVCVESSLDGFPKIEIDNQAGGGLAARHVLDRGYKKPAFIGDIWDFRYAIHPSDERFRGFNSVLRKAGIVLDEARVILGPFQPDEILARSERMILEERPDVIFAASDNLAAQLLSRVQAMNYSVPRDLAILGFDNLPISQLMNFTTVDQKLLETGRAAGELLLSLVEKSPNRSRSFSVEMEVIARRSS